MITKLPTNASTKTTKNFTLSCVPKFVQTTLLSALFFLLLGVGESWGQVANYSFSQSTGTYSAITGTGVFASTTWDDNVATLTIPFTFTFNNVGYTSVSVNSNGYVTFGTTSSTTTNYTPISSTETYGGCISAFGRDLTNNAADVTYTTSGSSPNRVFIIQWNNARRYYSLNARNGNYNFQIRLNETTNVVQVVYNVATSTYATTLTHQIGLRGSANSDYLNRVSSTNFSGTTAGTANTATVSTGNTTALNPVAGQTYSWTPPAPCAAPTSLAATVTSSAQTNTTISGAFSAATTAPSGYVVVRTTTNTQPTLTNGTTYTVGVSGSNYIEYVGASAGSWTSTGLTAGNTYYYWVFSYNNTSCSGGPAYSATAATLTQATSSCSGASLASLSYTLASPTYCSGVAITTNTATLGTTNGTVTYSVSPALPTGLTLNTSTGAITGTPSATSAATAYTVTANNGCTSTTATVTIAVVTPLSALSYTTVSPTYCVGTAITSNAVTITGGGTITYSVSPALPAGLSLNTATGEITGTPTVSATSATYTVTATNGSCSTTKALTIVVNNNLSSSTLTYTSQAVSYCRSAAITTNSATLSPSTNNGTVTYAVSPALPTGLSLNTSTGAISGTPTVAQTAASYTITATSACGGSTTSVVSITVNTPGTVTPPSAATICSGGSGTSLTASGIANYTWTPTTGLSASNVATVTANPTATTTYTISGTDANGCTASTGTVTVTVNQTPSAITIAQTPASVCSGSVATLTANGGTILGTAVIGTATTVESTSTSHGAFNGYRLSQMRQTIFTAAELSAAGLVAGNITALAYNINSQGSSTSNNITIKIGTTSNSAFATNAFYNTTSYTTVFGPSSYTHTASGWQTITFTTPFTWNGTSNIVVDVWQDGPDGTADPGTYYTATSDYKELYYWNSAAGSSPTSTVSSLNRFNVTFTGAKISGSVAWSPTTNLYTNAGATTAYTGSNATTVYAVNTASTQYTATSTNGSCSSSSSINTSINPLPTITLGSASAVCAGGTTSSLSYTATTGSPNQYIIDFDATANAAGFVDVTSYTSFSSSPITLIIPSGAAAGTYNGTITVKNSTTGCVGSATSFTVTVNAPVSITTQPNNSVSLEGSDATFSVTATGTGLTYQWQVSSDNGATWNNASGTSTNSSYTEYAISASMAGYQYRCIVSGTAPCGSVTSSVATLTISTTAITSQPASATICSNGSNTFTISTSGSTPTYQWQESTDAGVSYTDISGATTSSLTVSGLTSANSGNRYRCVLSSSIYSDAAVLTVYNAVAIGTQPVSQIVCSNDASVSFSVSASGSNLTYQWQVSTNGGSSWSNASGTSTNSTYTISSITNALNLNQYRVIVSGSSPCAAVTSNAATLNVTGVTVSTSASSICLNNTITLTATPTTGVPTLSYSWICATTGSGATSAQTSNPATITPTAAGSYTYILTATGGGCTLTSTTAVTVNALPTITSATASPASLCAGSSVSLNAASIPSSSGISGASGAGASTSSSYPSPFGNSWWGAKQQFIISAADLTAMGLVAGNITSVAFDITTVATASLTNYTISAKHTNTSAFTSSGTFETGLTTLYSSVSYTPSSSTGYSNNTITFNTPFAWNGTSNIVFEICFNNSAYTSNASCTYTTKTYYTACYYYDDVSGVCGQTLGSYISYNLPNMKFNGQLGTVNTANYTWSWNTTPSVSTAAGSTTAVNATNSPISQTYTVTATNAGTGCSSSATTSAITINPTPATPTANSTTICGAQNATCSVTGSGVVGNTFKWYTASTGGTAIAGQTGSSLNAYPVSATTTFYVSEANATCESARVAVTQTVTTPPTVTTAASSSTICAGQPTTLSVSSANSGYSYSWSNSAGTGSSVSVSPSATTTYTVTATDTSGGASNGCTTLSTISVKVNPIPSAVTISPTSTSICNGNNIQLNGSPALINNVTGYSVSVSSGASLQDVTGGTDLIGQSQDDLASSVANIGFNFVYEGTTYTQFSANSNGLIRLGGTVVSNDWTNALADVTDNPKIMPLWDDISTGTSGYVRFKVNGTAPNRILVVEHFVRLDATETSASTSTFQTLFYETSNLIEFVYGSSSMSMTSATIGISGIVNTNYMARKNVANNNFGISSAAENITTWPGQGTKYTFVPAPTYAWSGGPIASGGSSASATVNPTSTTTYTLTSTNVFGCSVNTNANVTVNQPSVAPTSISGTTTICNGSSTTLTANGTLGTGANYQWGTGSVVGTNTISGETSATLTVSPTSTTIYWVRITNGTAPCTATTSGVTATVTVNQPSVAPTSISGTTTICNGANTTLTAVGGTLGTGATYEWGTGSTVGTNAMAGTGSSITVSPTSDTTYWVRITNGTSPCSAITDGVTATVTVNPLPTATISTGSATTFCSGGSVVLTASAGSSYVWKKDGNTIPGAAAQTYTATTAGAYTVTVTNANGCSATSAATTVTVNTSPNMPTASNVTLCGTGSVTLTADNPGAGLSVNWYNTAQDTQLATASLTYTTPSLSTTTSYYAESVNTTTGCVSTNRVEVQAIVNVTNTFTDTTNDHKWFTAANWSCGSVPNATTNVVIPTAKIVDVDGAAAYANTIELQGTANVTVTTNDSMNVTNKVTVASGATFTVQNNASLVQTDNVANEGVITVQKSTPSSRLLKRNDAVLWSSPVNQKIKAISTGTPDAYFMQHDPQANSWSAVSSPATADFTKGKGFLVRTPSTFPTTATQQWSVNFTGVPNNGDVTISAGNTGAIEKYLLVGNPYPSAISIAAFKAANPNITGVFYFYRKPNGVTSISAYGTLDADGNFATNDANEQIGALSPGSVIPSGQGFFVAMKSDSNNGDVFFTNAMRVANDHGQFNRLNANTDKYKLVVKTTGTGNSQMIVSYKPESTLGFDLGLDAVAFTDGTTDLSVITNNENYRIQARGNYNVADVIPVRFKTAVNGEHRISMSDVQGVFAADQMVIIKDNLTGTQHNLTANGDYVFTSAAGTFTNRFEVIYQQAYYTALQPVSCGSTLSTMSSLVYADIVNGATGYRFKVVNNTTAAVQTIDRPQHWFAFNMLSAYDYNTAYTISVQVQKDGVWTGYYGTSCTVNSPNIATTGVMQINPSQCGMTLPTLGTVIATTPVAGATGYKFRITNTTAGAMGNNLVQEITRTNHWFTLAMLARYNYGSSYAIEVAVKTTGGYTPYGNACTVYAPAVPTLASCGQTVATSTTLVRTTATTLATQYRFQVTRIATQETITFDTANYWFSFRVNVPGYAAGEQYGVRVAVMTAGAWSPYGDACDITAPIATARTTEEAAPSEANLYKPVAYPNPFASAFSIALATPFQDDVTLVVYDLQGRLIEKQTIPVNLIDTIHIGANYQMGDYMLVVSQGPAIESMLLHKE